MSVDEPSVAADAPAAQRLDEEFDVESRHERGHYLFSLDNKADGLAVIVYAGTDVDAGQLHASIAAVCHHGMATIDDDREVLE